MNTINSNQNDLGVIIVNEKDRKVFNYVVKSKGADLVVWAVNNLDGNRRPYISNIAKKLKVDIPPENELPDPDKIVPIDKGLEMLSQVIRIRRRKK